MCESVRTLKGLTHFTLVIDFLSNLEGSTDVPNSFSMGPEGATAIFQHLEDLRIPGGWDIRLDERLKEEKDLYFSFDDRDLERWLRDAGANCRVLWRPKAHEIRYSDQPFFDWNDRYSGGEFEED